MQVEFVNGEKQFVLRRTIKGGDFEFFYKKFPKEWIKYIERIETILDTEDGYFLRRGYLKKVMTNSETFFELRQNQEIKQSASLNDLANIPGILNRDCIGVCRASIDVSTFRIDVDIPIINYGAAGSYYYQVITASTKQESAINEILEFFDPSEFIPAPGYLKAIAILLSKKDSKKFDKPYGITGFDEKLFSVIDTIEWDPSVVEAVQCPYTARMEFHYDI